MLIPRMAARRAAGSDGDGVDLEGERQQAAAVAAMAPEGPTTAAMPSAAAARSGSRVPPPLWRDVHIPHAMKIMLGLCVLAFGALLCATRHLDFYYDEWSFLGSAHHWTPRSYFVPHNEHWSTVPMLIYKTLLFLNGAHSYLPFVAVLLLMHVITAFLLFMVVRRRCGDLLGLIAGTVLLFLGRGYEDIIWAFQIGFLGSVMFGLLALHLLGKRPAAGRARAVAGSAALLLALMSSGMGLFFLVVVGLDLVLDRDRRRLWWTLAVPSVAYVWWYLTFGRQGTAEDHSIFTFKTLEGLVGYAPTGIGAAAAGTFALSALWAPIAFAALTATAVLLWYRKRLDTGLAVPAAVGIVLQFTLTGLVRAHYGDSQATAPRYVYIGAVFVLLIVTEAVRDARWQGVWRTVAPVAAAALVVVTGASVLVHQERLRAKALLPQKYELEVTWLFRGAPGLAPNVVLDQRLLPVVTPSIYYEIRSRYGSPLPDVSVGRLAALPPRVVNNEMRLLMPLLAAAAPAPADTTVPAPGCRLKVASGGFTDLSMLGGSQALVQTLGSHATSQLVISTWYLGDTPDGGDQRVSASSGHDVRIRFPDTGHHLSWHFRLRVTSGSPVVLCLPSSTV